MKFRTSNHLHRLLVLLLLSPLSAFAQADGGDSVYSIKEVEVRSNAYTSAMKTDANGQKVLATDWLKRMPKVLGDANPLRVLQAMPGVHTNSEFDAGFYVEGCETSHTAVTIDGAPLYGVSHLLGLFSVFNTSHFHSMQMQYNNFRASAPCRLGAALNMHTSDSLPLASVKGEGSVGLMSAQGTWAFRTSKSTALTVSLRRSFLNEVYGPYLKLNELDMAYAFGDYNTTFLWKMGMHDLLKCNFYYGNDHVTLQEFHYQADMRLRWNNLLASALWTHHTDGIRWNASIFHTRYSNHFSIQQDVMDAGLKSSISQSSFNADVAWKHLNGGVSVSHFDVQPQRVRQNISSQNQGETPHSQMEQFQAFAEGRWNLGHTVQLKVGTKLFHLLNQGHHFTAVCPSLGLMARDEQWGQLRVDAGVQVQPLTQTGFSSRGFPTEFWVTPHETRMNPQKATGINVEYSRGLFRNTCRLELRSYYKHLSNQTEYEGDVVDLLYGFSMADHLLKGKGYNYGAGIMFHKVTGKLTGWLSYNWQCSKRKFSASNMDGWYSSNHERPHEWNVVATYRLSRHWDVGTNWVYASGTPFSSPSQFYLINGMLVTEYGEHNNSRLSPYVRVDLSVNYDFTTHGAYKHGVNFSLYNVTNHHNEVFYNLTYNRHDNTLSYRSWNFMLRVIPSISYYFKF